MKVPVVKEILKANDSVAVENRETFDRARVLVLDVMASPGAGKTSMLLTTLDRLDEGVRPGVIEGDVASSIDADMIAARDVPVVQINTGGNCHLDAPMVRSALPHMDLDNLDVLFIEDVGNLICPSNYKLGHHYSVVVSSVTEGHDKAHKYPGIFAGADVVMINKWDLADVFEYDLDFFTQGVRMVNRDVPILPLSSKTGEGFDPWMEWLHTAVGSIAPVQTTG
ncbi:MAG TPA: hydrogenase nickel incorporation protein HypB [Longimicrobiales bacterium]|nr:hydrogenase nickel incorporation protein HypB [Longimicrobiales bacterium]